MKKKAGYIDLYTRDISTKKWPSDVNFLIAFWGAILFFTVFLIIYGIVIGEYFTQLAENRSLTSQYKSLSLKDKQLLELSLKLRDLNIKSRALTSTIKSLEKLFHQKIKWIEFLDTFSGYLNDNVWINSLSIDPVMPDRRFLYVQVQGGAISLKDLNRFVENVERENQSVKVSFKVVDKKGVLYYSFGLNFTFDTKRIK